MKRILVFATLFFVAWAASAQVQSDLCVQYYTGPTINLVRSEMLQSNVYPSAGIRLGVNTRPNSASPYAALYGYPTIGLEFGWHGLAFLHYSEGSHLEDMVTLSGFFERSLLRKERWSIDYTLSLGAGFNSATYDADHNPLNFNFSSPLLIHVAGGLAGKYRPTQHLELGVALRLIHFSTGRLAYPNNGLNLLSVEVSARYQHLRPYTGGEREGLPAVKPWGVEVSVGGGLHRCANEWRAFGSTHPWPAYTQQLAAYWRYQPHLSTGLGMDVVFNTPEFLDRVEAAERVQYGDAAVDAYGKASRTSLGFALTQQFHYGNFSLYGSFGVYARHRLGLHEQQGWCYQKAGVKIYIPRIGGIFLAADCLAHNFSHAAMIEFSLGYKI